MKISSLLFLPLLLLTSCPPASQKSATAVQLDTANICTIYLLRHAEKDLQTPGVDKRNPPLSAAGIARAQQLKHVLKDAGISHIFSSDYIRTRNTVKPLAEALGIELELYNPRELEGLAERLKGMKGKILVSGHSNSTPKLVKLLGGEAGAPIVEKTEFDRLYVITIVDGQLISSTLMRYGAAAAN